MLRCKYKMAYRKTPFVTGELYHLYNCGVEKRNIFITKRDYNRFQDTFLFYQFKNPPTKFSLTPRGWKNEGVKLINILCYCLMPNHFHFLVKQLTEKGISTFMSRLENSYTKYFNTKNKRLGHLFQGAFKAIRIENDEQLLHLSRYIHLNPYVAEIVEKPETYKWSSYLEYISPIKKNIFEKELILSFFKKVNEYTNFVLNHADYARALEKIKHLTLDS